MRKSTPVPAARATRKGPRPGRRPAPDWVAVDGNRLVAVVGRLAEQADAMRAAGGSAAAFAGAAEKNACRLLGLVFPELDPDAAGVEKGGAA